MPILTIHDLKPGHLYQVVEVGARDPLLLGATVLAASAGCTHKAVTVMLAPSIGRSRVHGLGSHWSLPDDAAARFVPQYAPVVIANPTQ